MILDRKLVIAHLFDLQLESADYLETEDMIDYEQMSDDDLLSAYCGSGLFQNDWPAAFESDIEGIV